MKNPCDKYEHTFKIKVRTQFLKDSTLSWTLKQMLGEWCNSIVIMELNRDTEKQEPVDLLNRLDI